MICPASTCDLSQSKIEDQYFMFTVYLKTPRLMSIEDVSGTNMITTNGFLCLMDDVPVTALCTVHQCRKQREKVPKSERSKPHHLP